MSIFRNVRLGTEFAGIEMPCILEGRSGACRWCSELVSVDYLILAGVFANQDKLHYLERLGGYQREGLSGEVAGRSAAKDVLRSRPMTHALYVAAHYWEIFIPASYGDAAWSWIREHSHHGAAINQAESEIDQIGKSGMLELRQQACGKWVYAWRTAMEAWRADFISNGKLP